MSVGLPALCAKTMKTVSGALCWRLCQTTTHPPRPQPPPAACQSSLFLLCRLCPVPLSCCFGEEGDFSEYFTEGVPLVPLAPSLSLCCGLSPWSCKPVVPLTRRLCCFAAAAAVALIFPPALCQHLWSLNWPLSRVAFTVPVARLKVWVRK